MNHSELSHMAGAVDDSTINIAVVIIIIIIIIIIWGGEVLFTKRPQGNAQIRKPQKPLNTIYYRTW